MTDKKSDGRVLESKKFDVQLTWANKIPIRDGIALSAILYLPRGEFSPAPAVFTLTPYIGQTYHERGLFFAAHGYPFLIVDSRGRGNSEGVFRPLIQEAQDGYDVVEWLAKQPYCDGRVAMWGGSYAGYNQWATAKELPPHLATIVPVASVYPGLDFPMRNNMMHPYVIQWLTFVSGRASQERMYFGSDDYWKTEFQRHLESGVPFRNLDKVLGNISETFQEWISHPMRDSFWDSHSPTADEHAKIGFPILTITGIYDADQPGALAHYREHMKNAPPGDRVNHYLVIGPWDHAGTRTPQRDFAGAQFGTESMLDMNELHLQWYDWTMRNGSKPSFLQGNVAYYVTGSDCWRYSDTLDGITYKHQPLYLDSKINATAIFESGVLTDKVGSGSPDCYVYDPNNTDVAQNEPSSTASACMRPIFPSDDITDQRVVFLHEGRSLIYHGDPFLSDIEISGFFRLEAWISIDQRDTDFGVSVYEVDDRGASILLAVDAMRARYRQSLRRELLVNTTDALCYHFDSFTFVSRVVRRGSRLRLVIAPMHSIFYQKNYNSGKQVSEESMEDARRVTIRLHHSQAHPSVLHVPIGTPRAS